MEYIFSKRLKELRTSLGLTQTEFAKEIGTTQATLSSYENNNKVPPVDVLMSICEKYQVSLDWLCGLNNQKTPTDKIATYSDLIQILLLLSNAPDIYFEQRLSTHTPSNPFLDNPYDTLICEFNDAHIVDFFQEWNDIKAVCKKSPIGDKLFALWLKDILERYNFPLEDAHRSFIDEALPFD